jgi:peptide/nickel transport system substrate-binding protein
MRLKSWRSAVVVLAIMAVTASACSSSKKSTAGTTTAGKVADSFVLGTTDSLQNSFDPAQAYDYFGADVVWNVAETLVTYAPNATTASPLLAKELPKVSADGLTYTFTLRDGVKFQDGTAMDAAAVKFSLLRAQAFGNKDSESAGFLLSGIKTIDTPSANNVIITLDKPNKAFLSRLAYTVAAIVSPAAYKDNVLAGTETGDAVLAKYKKDTVVGTGPYKIVSYTPRTTRIGAHSRRPRTCW